MSQYTVFGREITFSEGLDRFGENRKHAVSVARKEGADYINFYYRAGDIETVLDTYDGYASEIYEKIKKELHGKLVNEFNLYDLSYDTFSSEYCDDLHHHFESFEEVADEYNDIVAEQEGAKQYRANRKDSRARWEGGGFGMSGAIQGSIDAGAMNLASGAAHGAVNLIGNGIDAIKASRAKKRLYERRDVPHTLSWGINGTVQMIYAGYRRCINERYDQDYFDFRVDDERASAILENLQNLSDEEKKKELICEVFQADPIDSDIYEYVLDNYGDPTGVFEEMCTSFCNYDIVEAKQEYLDAELCEVDFTKKDSVIEAKKMVDEKCNYYKLDAAPYQKALDTIISEYEKTETYCDGFYYENESDINKAKAERDEFVELTTGLDGNDETKMLEIKDKITNEYEQKSKDKYLEFIDKALKDYDLRYRTVFGDEYNSRKEADQAKSEIKDLIDIKSSIGFDSLEGIQDACVKTKAGAFSDKLKNQYVSVYEECENKWKEITDAQQCTFSNRMEQTKLAYKLLNLQDDCRFLGINNKDFDEYVGSFMNDMMTVNGEKAATIEESNKRYYKLLFKAQSYKSNVVEKESAPKKGLFSKMMGDVKGALSSGNLSEYNYFTEDGTKELPTDDKSVRDEVISIGASLNEERRKNKAEKDGYKYFALDKPFSLEPVTLNGKKIVEPDLKVSGDFIVDTMRECTEFDDPEHLPEAVKKPVQEEDEELAELLAFSESEGDNNSADETAQSPLPDDSDGSDLEMIDYWSEEFDNTVSDWGELDDKMRAKLGEEYSYVEYAEFHEDVKKLYIEGEEIMPDIGDPFDLYNYRGIKIVNRPCAIRSFTDDGECVNLDKDIEKLLSIQGTTSPYYVCIK